MDNETVKAYYEFQKETMAQIRHDVLGLRLALHEHMQKTNETMAELLDKVHQEHQVLLNRACLLEQRVSANELRLQWLASAWGTVGGLVGAGLSMVLHWTLARLTPHA